MTRPKLSAQDKRDNAAFDRGMRELRKNGGLYMTDARDIALPPSKRRGRQWWAPYPPPGPVL